MNTSASVVQRRLGAIVCADVAGCTRLMNADEAGTLRLLASHRAVTDRLEAPDGARRFGTGSRGWIVKPCGSLLWYRESKTTACGADWSMWLKAG